ncbi:MAG: carboxypeptidase-like regulatory domain-containing protein [Balneolaceae bacterium]|nr:carboxypeptidase-like regulatory domain-containing protein [Balneolaceae bacterium]
MIKSEISILGEGSVGLVCLKKLSSVMMIFVGLFLAPMVSPAQNSGTLSGFVTDAQTGEPLPGATVQIEGTKRGTAADTNGYFAIENVPPKSYTVTASFVGYQSATKYNVVVKSGNNPDLSFALEPSVSELDEISVEPDPYEQPPENPLSRQELSQVQIASYPGVIMISPRWYSRCPGIGFGGWFS